MIYTTKYCLQSKLWEANHSNSKSEESVDTSIQNTETRTSPTRIAVQVEEPVTLSNKMQIKKLSTQVEVSPSYIEKRKVGGESSTNVLKAGKEKR